MSSNTPPCWIATNMVQDTCHERERVPPDTGGAGGGQPMTRLRRSKKVVAPSGFVKKSARLSHERTKGTTMKTAKFEEDCCSMKLYLDLMLKCGCGVLRAAAALLDLLAQRQRQLRAGVRQRAFTNSPYDIR